MDIRRVRYSKEGEPYIARINKKGVIRKDFGSIKICVECGKKFFARKDKVGDYCSNKCQTQLKNHPRWHGGYTTHSGGYTVIRMAKDINYAYEHRIVMERHLGRPLNTDEHVHHIDRNKKNNNINNLVVLPFKEHMALHRKERVK